MKGSCVATAAPGGDYKCLPLDTCNEAFFARYINYPNRNTVGTAAALVQKDGSGLARVAGRGCLSVARSRERSWPGALGTRAHTGQAGRSAGTASREAAPCERVR